MKALRYLGPKQLEVTDAPKPQPKDDEVLIRVRAVGICGSDVHGWLGITGRRVPGVIMGHELSGTVEAVGENVKSFQVGDAVVPQPIDSCGTCEFCKAGRNQMCAQRTLLGVMDVNGGMAEFVPVKENMLYHKPENLSFETAALIEPLTVAYTAVHKLSDYRDKNVLVIGGGTIGLCILKMLKDMQPKRIIVSDLSEERRKTAIEMGADAVIDPSGDYVQQLTEITGGRLADITIEAVGVEAAVNQSIRALHPTGTSIWVGVSQQEMTINMHDVVCKDRTIIGSMNYSHQDFGETIKMLQEGRIENPEQLISDRISLEEAPDMFADLHDNPDLHKKALILFPDQ